MRATRPPYRRMLWLDQQLREGRYPNAVSMSRELEVSTRTCHRDIEYLKLMFEAPLSFDRARNGYCYTDPGFSLPAISITEGELLAVLVAEKALLAYSGTPFEPELRRAFDKLTKALPDGVTIDFAGLEPGLSFDLGPLREIDPAKFRLALEGIQQRRRLHVLYHTQSRDADSEREIDPYRLHNDRGDWYLIGFCHRRREVRKFLLARIRDLWRTSITFEPTDFDVNEYLRQSFGIMVSGEPTQVVVEFDPPEAAYVRERQWHETQELTELGEGRLRLSMTVTGLDEVRRWIFQYAGAAEVVQPASLRREVARLAAATASRNA